MEKLPQVRKSIENLDEEKKKETVSFSSKKFQSLPKIVQKYLKYALEEGQEITYSCKLTHVGQFWLKEKPSDITGSYLYSSFPPQFYWEGRISMFCIMNCVARDSLVQDKGNMNVKINNLLTVVNVVGEDIDSGSAMRFLAECVMFPSFFLSDYITFEEIEQPKEAKENEELVKVTLKLNKNLEVFGFFHFDKETGRIVKFSGKRMNGDTNKLENWWGTFEEYKEFQVGNSKKVKAPTLWKVYWDLESGKRLKYVDWPITSLEYNTL